MENVFVLLAVLFSLLGTQCFVAYRVTRGDIDIVLQLTTVGAVAVISSVIWYLGEVKYGWSLPSRYTGLGVPHPKHDAGVMFAMGLVWYVIVVIGRFNRRK